MQAPTTTRRTASKTPEAGISIKPAETLTSEDANTPREFPTMQLTDAHRNRTTRKKATPAPLSPDECKKLATPQERIKFRTLSQEHQELEMRLINIESFSAAIAQKNIVFRILAQPILFLDRSNYKKIRQDLLQTRMEEQVLIKEIHERARRARCNVFHSDASVPKFILRASVPCEKQGKVPRYSDLLTALKEQVKYLYNDADSMRLTVTADPGSFILSRKDAAGRMRSIMFREREDGKVTYYKYAKAPGSQKGKTHPEWTRKATLWNDEACSVALEFMNSGKTPRVPKYKPSGELHEIAPVTFQTEGSFVPTIKARSSTL